MAENDRLSKKQLQAIIELLSPSTQTIAAVAKKLAIGERTLYRWLTLPNFQQRLDEERKKLRDQAFDNLKSTLNEAVGVLRGLLNSDSDSIKLKCAQAVLDYNIKVAEIEELEERLSKLEGSNK